MSYPKHLFRLYHLKIILCLFVVSACCPMKNWEKEDTCSLLKEIVEIKEFEKVFHINFKKEELLIVDTTKFFANCSFETESGRKVRVSNILDKTIKHIAVLECKRTKKSVELFFHQQKPLNIREMSGPILLLKVKRSRNKNTITDVRCGSF